MDTPLSERPFWWSDEFVAASRPHDFGPDLPSTCDVAIIGSGMAGLAAAIELAGAGRHTVVLDAGPLGGGASSRNFGTIGVAAALMYPQWLTSFGAGAAAQRVAAAESRFDHFLALARELGDGCGFDGRGVVYAALDPATLDRWAEAVTASQTVLRAPPRLLSQREVRDHLASDLYVGGLLLADAGAFDPGRFVAHLIARVRSEGATLSGHCRVDSVSEYDGKFCLEGASFSLCARQLVVAGNGYLHGLRGAAVKSPVRDVVPVEANMIATEELAPERVLAAFPSGTAVADTRKNFFCMRPSPDGRRVLFASRTGIRMDARQRADALKRDLLGVLPQLGPVAVTHSWPGMIAMTRDGTSHAQIDGNLGYIAGCNGSGLLHHFSLGRRVAQALISGDQKTLDEQRPLPKLLSWLPKPAIVRAMTWAYARADGRMLRTRTRDMDAKEPTP